MGDIEWVRFVIIAVAVIAIAFLSGLYVRKRQPIIIAGISWLLLVVLFSLFKLAVDGDLAYYNASIVFNAVIFVYGAVLLILAGWALK